MTVGLERRYGHGHYHFVTFSCYRRQPHLADSHTRDVFEQSLEHVRRDYDFGVDAYVVMPEHVHLLVSEPKLATLSVAIQALKISVARRFPQRPFWQRRFYDFNVFTDAKRIEKRRYIHRNPFTRGLVHHPAEWQWSSYRHWACGEQGTVKVESVWTFAEKMRAEAEQAASKPTSQKLRCGAAAPIGEVEERL
jgi:putative transposase